MEDFCIFHYPISSLFRVIRIVGNSIEVKIRVFSKCYRRRVCYAPFPLILTFSLREKEQQLYILAFAKTIRAADHLQFVRKLGAFPPLPRGEGRGEGKVTIHSQRRNLWLWFFKTADRPAQICMIPR
jgi:hypothetical protein